MNAHITEFLEQVRPFLVAADEQDVLREIAGSIEDREAAMPGGDTDENMVAAIAAMGDPRDVAAAWSTGKPAVAVNYQKVQWLLAGLLYAVTVGLAATSAVAGSSIFLAPLFYVPSLTPLSLLYYLPFSFVFDYGLASILIQVNEHFGNRVGPGHRAPRARPGARCAADHPWSGWWTDGRRRSADAASCCPVWHTVRRLAPRSSSVLLPDPLLRSFYHLVACDVSSRVRCDLSVLCQELASV